MTNKQSIKRFNTHDIKRIISNWPIFSFSKRDHIIHQIFMTFSLSIDSLDDFDSVVDRVHHLFPHKDNTKVSMKKSQSGKGHILLIKLIVTKENMDDFMRNKKKFKEGDIY
ncbi:hypothetical protein M3202_18465 [Alkalihalobacillus oceani]|uniref:Uncharacterized protein n=1 Tax=Halalkalibacter oceani TaxID=1653776 RepID=A0A9X2DSB9_9BACI|nr:hypothetical protein [Halalkalibacter oceani]MCM3716039.1 hypothetical protein [Halalkalibacter oceani]